MENIRSYPGDRSWLSQLAFWRSKAIVPPHVSFADLVRIHFDWRHHPEDAALTERYHDALAAFQHHEGRVDEAHWCVDRASGAAVTIQPMRRTMGGRPRYRFHRVSAWATQPSGDITRLLNTCDELGRRTSEVLRGTGARICMGLVMNSAKNLLALVDAPSQLNDPADTAKVIEAEQKALGEVSKEYKRTATRQAQLVYLLGALAGIVFLTIAVLAVLWLLSKTTSLDWLPKDSKTKVAATASVAERTVSLSMLYLCAIAGAIGAIVSLIARINANSCSVDYEAGRMVTFLLGTLRPALGAVFGIALYAALVSGLLQLFEVPADDQTKQFYFFLVIAFLAGFSERWARDVLVDLEQAPAPAVPANQPAENV